MVQDADTIRAKLRASGYPCVIIAWSELEFLYHGYAIYLLQQHSRLHQAGALQKELVARFGGVSKCYPHLEELWGTLNVQIYGAHSSLLDGLASKPPQNDLGRFPEMIEDLFRPLNQEVKRLTGMWTQEVCWADMSSVTYQLLRAAWGHSGTAPDINAWHEVLRQGSCFALLRNGVAVVLPLPEFSVDIRMRFHREDGPAVRWQGIGGQEHYYWHGVRVPPKVVLRPEKITREEICAQRNSEVTRVIAQRLGWDRYLDVVGAVLIDTWSDPATGSQYQLYDFKIRKDAMMPRLLKMQSPELQDGTRPFYVEPVPPGIINCRAARKWQFRAPDGRWPSPHECNANPAMEFDIET